MAPRWAAGEGDRLGHPVGGRVDPGDGGAGGVGGVGGVGHPDRPAAAGDGPGLAAHWDPGDLGTRPGVDAGHLAGGRVGDPHRAVGGADRARRAGSRATATSRPEAVLTAVSSFAPENITGAMRAVEAA